MKRTIKFRGFNIISNKWVYGSLLKIGDNYHIVDDNDMHEDGHHIRQESDFPTWVDPKTIGQFTGRLDKEGKEIYDDDIEYTRTDAFIEKAEKFFTEKFEVEDYNDNIDIDGSPIFNYGRFIEDFKKYMEGGEE